MLIFLLGCQPTNTKIVTEPSEEGVVLSDSDGDGYYGDDDCNDSDASINEGEIELCDGIDNNCDGQIDEGVTEVFYLDSDGDGFGLQDQSLESCEASEGYVSNGNDCDDEEPFVYPGASEICDDLDNDCNDIIDDGVGEDFFEDVDGDGYGDSLSVERRCELEDGLSNQGGDCDDSNNQIYPQAPEYCDDLDNDCNGLVDDGGTFSFYLDADSDGYGDSQQITQACFPPEGYVSNADDCNDLDTEISPLSSEVCDGIDNDCDGTEDNGAMDSTPWYLDLDQDGYGDGEILQLACVQPPGYSDNDDDCDDTTPLVSPASDEICDSVDNNCNALIDSDDPLLIDAPIWYLDYDEDDYGNSEFVQEACVQPEDYVSNSDDCNDLTAQSNPAAPEQCDGLDNDCDGQIDEGVTEVFYLDSDGDGYGTGEGVLACEQPDGYVENSEDCDDENILVFDVSEAELCDGIDNNCDGQIDEGVTEVFYLDSDGDGYGTGEGVLACDGLEGYSSFNTDCDDVLSTINPAASEICDDIDNNCDGQTDEGWNTSWYLDYDGDDYGDSNQSTIACQAPPLFVEQSGDCNDLAAEYNPSVMPSACDGEDLNCDGIMDNDYDGDLHPGSSCGGDDCDDTNALVFPGAEDIWYDGVDSNCDGLNDYDQDGDGYVAIGYEGLTNGFEGDCDDEDSDFKPESNALCALGTTCKDIMDRFSEYGDGNYIIDPDGWGQGLYPFDVYCDMTTDGGGWTEIPYASDLVYGRQFFDGDARRWLDEDFSLLLSQAQIESIQQLSTEGRQTYVGLCNGVLHYYYNDGSNYSNSLGFRFLDGTQTQYGLSDYDPYDIDVIQDGCAVNGGEGGALENATIFEISSALVPVVNISSSDNGDGNEFMGSLLLSNPAWLR